MIICIGLVVTRKTCYTVTGRSSLRLFFRLNVFHLLITLNRSIILSADCHKWSVVRRFDRAVQYCLAVFRDAQDKTGWNRTDARNVISRGKLDYIIITVAFPM